MSVEKAKRIRLIYGCISTALIALCAVLLIIGCLRIYQSGDRPYSREAVAAALQSIAIPGWLCLASVLGGIVLHLILPTENPKYKARRNESDALAQYQEKYAELTADEQNAVRKEVTFRRAVVAVTAVACCLLALYPIVYYADAGHFTVENLGADVVKALIVAMIPAAAALVLVYICRRLWDASILRETDIYRKHPVKPGKIAATSPASPAAARWVCLAVAVALIVLGVINGGHKDVLDKAIKICTECIGLG